MCGTEKRRFQRSDSHFADFKSCFGINIKDNKICEGCRRAVQETRSNGKIFYDVSLVNHCAKF